MTKLITEGAYACQQFVRNRSLIVLADRRQRGMAPWESASLDPMRNERGLSWCALERRSVKEPDRQRSDGNDAKKDQHERDVRLPLRVVLGKTIHLSSCRPGKAHRALHARRRPQVPANSSRGTPRSF